MKKTKSNLNKTKQKVSTEWLKYRHQKQKILNSRISSAIKVKRIDKLLNATRSKISSHWSSYSGLNVKFLSSIDLAGGKQKNYTVKGNVNSKTIRFLKDKLKTNVRYILVVLKIRLEETEQIIHISQSFTPIALSRILDKDFTNELEKDINIQAERKHQLYIEYLKTNSSKIFEEIQKYLITREANKNKDLNYDLTKGYEILNISFRLFYENSKNHKNK